MRKDYKGDGGHRRSQSPASAISGSLAPHSQSTTEFRWENLATQAGSGRWKHESLCSRLFCRPRKFSGEYIASSTSKLVGSPSFLGNCLRWPRQRREFLGEFEDRRSTTSGNAAPVEPQGRIPPTTASLAVIYPSVEPEKSEQRRFRATGLLA